MTYHKISCELLREISFSSDQLTVVDSDWTPRGDILICTGKHTVKHNFGYISSDLNRKCKKKVGTLIIPLENSKTFVK